MLYDAPKMKAKQESFIESFNKRCYSDLIRLSQKSSYKGGGISWVEANKFFSIKYRFTKEMTRMLIEHLSAIYPLSFNKFSIKVAK
jgi:hypothetical protein